MSAKLPGIVTKSDSLGQISFNGSLASEGFRIGYISKASKIKEDRQIEIALNGFVRGYTQRNAQMRMYKHTVIDTAIGGLFGKFITSVDPPLDFRYQRIYTFVTVANNHFYTIAAFDTHLIGTNIPHLNKFLNSIKFNTKNIRESSSEYALYQKSYRAGQRLGAIILYGLIPILILSVILFLIFRRRKNRNGQI